MGAEGLYEKLQGRLAPEAVAHYYAPGLQSARETAGELIDVLLAHVVMLTERGIIGRTEGQGLIKGLRVFKAIPPAELPLDPFREDLYVNLEHFLEQEIGAEIAGHLSVARSRNDIEAAMGRIRLRVKLNALARSMIRLIEVLARQADMHAETLMPGFTHAQPAQPITLGFYFMAIAQPLMRHLVRLSTCYDLTDEGPLGAAAMSGTGFPIDRDRTGELLGFPRKMVNALDAVAANDHMCEAALLAAQIAGTLGRLGEDLVRWTTFEAHYLHLGLGFSDSSSIMPQKRNPVMAETLRSQARQVAAEAAGVVAAGTAPYEPGRDITVAEGRVWDLLSKVTGMCRVAAGMVDSLTVFPDRMALIVHESACTVTELVDSLVRHNGISFRQAHRIVGAAVSELLAKPGRGNTLSIAMLEDAAQHVQGRPLGLTQEQLEAALDPRRHLELRAHTGGPDPENVRQMATDARAVGAQFSRKHDEREDRLDSAAKRLTEACDSILVGSPNR